MGWKDGPSWLKGGIISFGILTILAIIGGLSGLNCFGCSDDACCMQTAPLGYSINFFMSNIINFPLSFMPETYATASMANFSMIVYLFYYFLIGALIGLIYEKISPKSKKEKKK